MINKLVQKKNVFLMVGAIIFAILWMLTLIFGNGEDKWIVLILSFIMPFVIYGLVRLMFRVNRSNVSLKFMNFSVYFFLIVGVLSGVMDVVCFISAFPNGLSPALTACLGLVVAVLDEAKKNIEIENK